MLKMSIPGTKQVLLNFCFL